MSFDTRLFVGNLPDNTTEADLRSAFSSYGQIVNLELKAKLGAENDTKKFGFIRLSSSDYDVESCIRNFSTEDFKGNRLYVTRARESFLERLQRERQQEKEKCAAKNEVPKLPEKQPVMKFNDSLNPHKRNLEHEQTGHVNGFTPKWTKRKAFNAPEAEDLSRESSSQYKKPKKNDNRFDRPESTVVQTKEVIEDDKKKLVSDKKRLESMKKKREEFRQKQSIIKTGLVAVDKVPNKKVVFSDSDDDDDQQFTVEKNNSKEKTNQQQKPKLFDNDSEESDYEGDDMNFEIKEQFEGKKGQKVLELQSRYKSDKRFTLDERFVEDDGSEHESQEKKRQDEDEQIDLGQTDEKYKQLNILQDVLGVPIRTRCPAPDADDNKKYKMKMGGMLRFDPSQPDHAKFLAPVEKTKQEPGKKSKKKYKDSEMTTEPPAVVEKVEVSKEQFYKVSETLKEAIEQPSAFSLRSLFSKGEEESPSKNDIQEQETDYIPLGKNKEPKVKNPFHPTDKNPFKYDSSDSEAEEEDTAKVKVQEKTEVKAVWKEKLFFSQSDTRLEEGLAFFNKPSNAVPKERRGLKSLMKKRLHNTERKEQMFKKKIGGRKKTMKKNSRKKS